MKNIKHFILIILGIIFSTPIVYSHYEKLKKYNTFNYLSYIIIFGLLIIVTAYLVDSSFNPPSAPSSFSRLDIKLL